MEGLSNTLVARSTSRSPDAVPHSDSTMMWGAKGSGKSVYIASLVYWSPPADAARRVCVLPANSTAAEWVADRVRALAGHSGRPTGDWGLGTKDSAHPRDGSLRFDGAQSSPQSPVPSPQSLVPSPQYKT